MPVYEYRCRECSTQFELKSGFEAGPEACCPRCKGLARRVIFAVPVIYKGSGFYVTDYPKGSKT
ncbi:MAG: zinc ribbon domain-containing protein [Chloroflexi bacterium]|nr:zinc ribbon domain-containing protein [Chloroflexota bacterium]